ncbi:hypothetical protein [Flectobacillus major]|jgi:hypothetical protein|uniref:hypothetical protein n=1 Tax=Flectobacillus major TaxID=103 RepID=UPI0004123260|nr:hypothetical protein [Flectobacillus major]
MEKLQIKKLGFIMVLLMGISMMLSSCVTHVRGYDYGYRRPYYGRPSYRYVVPPPRTVVVIPPRYGHQPRYSYKHRGRGRW